MRARVCVCMRAGGLAHVGLRGENSILMHNYFIYKKTEYNYIPYCSVTNTKIIIRLTINIDNICNKGNHILGGIIDTLYGGVGWNVVPTNPSGASYFLTPSLFPLDRKSLAN